MRAERREELARAASGIFCGGTAANPRESPENGVQHLPEIGDAVRFREIAAPALLEKLPRQVRRLSPMRRVRRPPSCEIGELQGILGTRRGGE